MKSTKKFFEFTDVITSVNIEATIRLTKRLAIINLDFIRTVSFIFIVESRHDAFFRFIRGEVPNSALFDTGISGI
jgi:hypothetical protein